MQPLRDFDSHFELLTGYAPFPWQQALFAEFQQSRFPKTCTIPTGLGKTSIIAIWLLSVAHHSRSRTEGTFPRRLVYVVNRRTVVDQATGEAEQLRKALGTPELRSLADDLRSLALPSSDVPLAISTLRGQFADNAEWRNDPARPAAIVGTVDMIGSRLLFSGYGCGFKSRPLHAGFLGQDALLVHDEAHLEPAFQELIAAIESEQQRCRSVQVQADFRGFRVMALTATSRRGGESFNLTDADRTHPVVRARIEAKKGISFQPVDDEKKTADVVAARALEHKDSGQAILVFLRRLDDVQTVRKKLLKEKRTVQLLTGTLRGLERDALAKQDPIFARFMRNPSATPVAGTVYLVCTSAGEVGVDMSADHMVCDLTPFDSMAQRFGRVNRFGDGDAQIDIVHPARPDEKKRDDDYDRARWATLDVLRSLPSCGQGRYDASPAALEALPAADRQAAFTPPPAILPATEILFDAWALTSVRDKLPGRPHVADWLHGIAGEPPETHVAWREEVDILAGELLEKYRPKDLIEDYPLKPHELLRDRTSRVFDHLEAMARRFPDLRVWLVEPDGEVAVRLFQKLVEKDAQKRPLINLADCTVLLPPNAGGLADGMLDGDAVPEEGADLDVADEWSNGDSGPSRRRVWDDDDPPKGMRLVRTIDTELGADDEPGPDDTTAGRRYWHWYVRPRSADDDGSRTARVKQELEPHLQSAKDYASALARKLGLSASEVSAVTRAAQGHDLGKDRALWQRSIRNGDYPRVKLAKSGGRMWPLDLNDYRHEFGSLLDVSDDPAFRALAPEVRDLVLHLIAAHHGRARPHFSANEAFDPQRTEHDAEQIAREVPRRFARLQRRYGRWGLAYLESLLRAADALASQPHDESDSVSADPPVQPQGARP